MGFTRAGTTGILLLLACCPSSAQTPLTAHRSLQEYSEAIEKIAQQVSPAVVQILVTARTAVPSADARRVGFVVDQQSTGSGVIVDGNGYILTNAHVVASARHIDVALFDQSLKHRTVEAQLVGLDTQIDLAVLKVKETGLPTLPFVDSETLRQGQVVLAMGSPLGLENSLTVGILSATRRHLKPDDPMIYLQTDAPINPGNSGGPLIDAAGRIVGINTLIFTQSGGSEGIGFAIPANLARRVYVRLREDGKIRRGAIGIVPQTITPVMMKALGLAQSSGVILADVAPRSAAEAAGLQPGDIVLKADGRAIREARELGAAIFQHPVGEALEVEILRAGQSKKLQVTVMERPNEPGRLEDLARDARVIRRLGAFCVPVDEKVNAILPGLRKLSGVAVAAIPAEFAGRNPGLLQGDVIYAINTKRVETVQELVDALYARQPGDSIALQIERQGQLQYIVFELE